MYLLLLVGARISHLYPGSVNHEEKSLKKLSKDVFLFNAVVFVVSIFVNIWNVDTAIIGFGFIVIISRAPGKENTLE